MVDLKTPIIVAGISHFYGQQATMNQPSAGPRDSSAHPGPKPADLGLEDVEAEGRSFSTRDRGPKRQNLVETILFWVSKISKP